MPDHATHTYDNIGRTKVQTILKALTDSGSRISGDNPWSVDTRNHGVKLRGDWDETARILTITITASDWYVPRKAVWEKIDALMRNVQDEQQEA